MIIKDKFNRTIFLISIALLCLVNLFVIFSYSQLKNDSNSLKQTVQNLELDKSIYFEALYYSYKSTLNKEQRSKLIYQNPELMLKLSTGEKLVLYVKEGFCGACLEKIFLDLEILSEKIGRDKILVLTDWGSNGKPIKSKDFIFDHFLIEKDKIPYQELDYLFLFVTDEFFNCKMFFLPDPFPDLVDQYFEEIIPEYFNAN